MSNLVPEKALEITLMARRVRRRILDMAYRAGGGNHLGGALSMVEIMATLYSSVMRLRVGNVKDEHVDRFILSKGHGVLGFFPVLFEVGLLKETDLSTYKQNGSELVSHPIMNLSLGVESSNGSLGHGLSMGSGLAWAAMKKQKTSKIFVLLGDGECNEGSVWEAAMLSAQLKLGNLVSIIDFNKLQSDGHSEEIINLNNLPNMWDSFGWNVEEVDGHNIEAIYSSLTRAVPDKPKVIIAHTVKGKGISFMENNNSWHHGRLTEKLYREASNELV